MSAAGPQSITEVWTTSGTISLQVSPRTPRKLLDRGPDRTVRGGGASYSRRTAAARSVRVRPLREEVVRAVHGDGGPEGPRPAGDGAQHEAHDGQDDGHRD